MLQALQPHYALGCSQQPHAEKVKLERVPYVESEICRSSGPSRDLPTQEGAPVCAAVGELRAKSQDPWALEGFAHRTLPLRKPEGTVGGSGGCKGATVELAMAYTLKHPGRSGNCEGMGGEGARGLHWQPALSSQPQLWLIADGVLCSRSRLICYGHTATGCH